MLVPLVLAAFALVSCAPASVSSGVADLTAVDWARGPVVLKGPWAFGDGYRSVPDSWSADEAGGPRGQGHGTYRLRVSLDPGAPPLALRWGTVSTAFILRVNGVEVARAGTPAPEASRAVPAYAPGTVRLPRVESLDLEWEVSNHDYRVGGLWKAPLIGRADEVEAAQWRDEVGGVALASALVLIALSCLFLYHHRRSEKHFLFLGLFAAIVGARALMTGEYPVVRMVPGLPFEALIRLEYLAAFLAVPTAIRFFATSLPALASPQVLRWLTWPSLPFVALVPFLPLDLLTRTMAPYHVISFPSVAVALWLVARRVLASKKDGLFLVGVFVLAGLAVVDMASAALFAQTSNLTSWGLGVFVGLQATTLARRFLGAFDNNEALLAEKELLIKEVHHRVKNSLQVVASLISLQSHRTSDTRQKEVYQALRKRITAIALVHEKLYGSGGGGRTDLGEYLRDLIALQYPGDGLSAGFRWTLEADRIEAGVDYCIDAGLIVTELVANALKYAQGETTTVGLALRSQDGRLRAEVVDDGPGFPPGFRPETSQGLGLRLILALLGRNEGSLEIVPGPGGRVVVSMRLPS